MIRAYFDETADEQSRKVYAIGGYWGEASQWDDFSYVWLDALESQGISAFHATDFYGKRGEFKGWELQRSIAFVRELMQIIHRFDVYGFHAAVKIDDFGVAFPSVSQPNAPHMLCMRACIENVLYMTEQLDEEVAFVFEDNQKAGYRPLVLYDLLKQKQIPGYKRMGSRGFVALKKFPPLQAADLIAWEGRKHLANEVQELDVPLRKTLKLLASKNRLFGQLWDLERLNSAKASGALDERFFDCGTLSQ
ncbi:MAG TPA: DUF3800 domain-containing protein [Candidatus Acidoferrum sp.]|nr:DUF3800 domain-containing protein [Candidatus Acidoferrum sp.]